MAPFAVTSAQVSSYVIPDPRCRGLGKTSDQLCNCVIQKSGIEDESSSLEENAIFQEGQETFLLPNKNDYSAAI
jgi:hypothetical protein